VHACYNSFLTSLSLGATCTEAEADASAEEQLPSERGSESEDPEGAEGDQAFRLHSEFTDAVDGMTEKRYVCVTLT